MKKKPSKAAACCPSVPPTLLSLAERPLLSFGQAVEVTALFKVLANDTRIRLLHHLARSGEESVTGLARSLGMKPQAVSNQLQRLADTGILASRREGNTIYYRIVNPCVTLLLGTALCIMEDQRQTPRAFAGKSSCPPE